MTAPFAWEAAPGDWSPRVCWLTYVRHAGQGYRVLVWSRSEEPRTWVGQIGGKLLPVLSEVDDPRPQMERYFREQGITPGVAGDD